MLMGIHGTAVAVLSMQVVVWCQSLKGHYFCAKIFDSPKNAQLRFPLTKMLYLTQGTKLYEGFLIQSKLKHQNFSQSVKLARQGYITIYGVYYLPY